MRYTNTEQVKRQIRIYINRNARAGKNTSLSGLFSFLRSLPTLNALGDYVLLSHMVSGGTFPLQDLRRKLFRVISHSSELSLLKKSEKTEIVESLMEVSL